MKLPIISKFMRHADVNGESLTDSKLELFPEHVRDKILQSIYEISAHSPFCLDKRKLDINSIIVPNFLADKRFLKRLPEGDSEELLSLLSEEERFALIGFTRSVMEYGRLNPHRDQNLFALLTHNGIGEAQRNQTRGYYPDIVDELDDIQLAEFLHLLRPRTHRNYPMNAYAYPTEDQVHYVYATGSFTLSQLLPDKEHIAKAHEDVVEGLMYVLFMKGASFIGLGGMSGAVTIGGTNLNKVINLLRHGLREDFTDYQIREVYPSILDARVSTGHTGTIAAIKKTMDRSDIEYPNRATSPIVIVGAGSIGGHLVDLLAYTGEQREVYVIDINLSTANNVTSRANTLTDSDNFKVVEYTDIVNAADYLKEAGTWILATSTSTIGSEPGFQKILEGSKNRPIIIDDCWPPVLTGIEIPRSVHYTEVALTLPYNLMRIDEVSKDLAIGNRVNKPLPIDNEVIAYSCEVEPLLGGLLIEIAKVDGELRRLAAKVYEANYGDYKFQSIENVEAQLQEFLKNGFTGEVRFEQSMLFLALIKVFNMDKITYHYNTQINEPLIES